jgi:hypothetical protein
MTGKSGKGKRPRKNPARDDEDQSKRFVEMARNLEANEQESFEKAASILLRPKTKTKD